MPAPLTSYITLSAIVVAVGPIPSTGRPPRGESICHSRLMPCSLTDQLPLARNPSVPWHDPDREVMLFQVIATQVVHNENH